MTDKILIAYYSRTGNTELIARIIQQEMGGRLHEIIPETPYPSSYDATVDQAKGDIKRGFKPPLSNPLTSVSGFDPIFIGSPNWWSTLAPPVATFLTTYDLSGKTIAPFCTHGGGGLGHISSDIAKLCPAATIRSPFKVYGRGSSQLESNLAAWLAKINLPA